MKTVALISGGKDSCYNMVQCVAEGHQIVALANLKPKDKDELDSYMYQTVGHQAIELYAEAMDLPLYRHTIQGSALETGRDYAPQDADEVEDLFQLLSKVKSEMEIEAVAVGAILSDYQRVRVDHVCLRLDLTPLAYLWRRDQTELMQEMVDCQIGAIIIKVAAMGLEPSRHLGLSLQQIFPHMLKMQELYGLNVCGEGGEYESFTLDCPLFRKKIVVDEKENVMHSDDAFAPVGYIRFKKVHLEDKGEQRPWEEIVRGLPTTTSLTRMDALRSAVENARQDVPTVSEAPSVPPFTDPVSPCCQAREKYFSVGGVMAVEKDDFGSTCRTAMDMLTDGVESLGARMSDVYSISLYVNKMSDFAAINAVYSTFFGLNPPIRLCVGACLPENVLFQVDCQGRREGGEGEGGGEAWSGERRTMHVQGLSHWAPANIGPYSQATVVGGRVFVAGQLPLVPGSMQLVCGGAAAQCRLALEHALSVLCAMCPGTGLPDVWLCVCYVTHPDVIPLARAQWREMCSAGEEKDEVCSPPKTSHRSLVEYVVVPSLPRSASVEWQVYARCESSEVKELEETCVEENFRAHTRVLQDVDTPTIYSVSTRVYFQRACQEDFDPVAAAKACLQGYGAMLSQLGKSWSDVPLLRIFYPARLCSYSSFLRALRQGLDCVSEEIVTMSLVPVIGLEDEKLAMLMCH